MTLKDFTPLDQEAFAGAIPPNSTQLPQIGYFALFGEKYDASAAAVVDADGVYIYSRSAFPDEPEATWFLSCPSFFVAKAVGEALNGIVNHEALISHGFERMT